MNITLPVVIDTLPGREMRTSFIEKKIFNSSRINKGLHLLSPAHVKRMMRLPF